MKGPQGVHSKSTLVLLYIRAWRLRWSDRGPKRSRKNTISGIITNPCLRELFPQSVLSFSFSCLLLLSTQYPHTWLRSLNKWSFANNRTYSQNVGQPDCDLVILLYQNPGPTISQRAFRQRLGNESWEYGWPWISFVENAFSLLYLVEIAGGSQLWGSGFVGKWDLPMNAKAWRLLLFFGQSSDVPFPVQGYAWRAS